MKKVKYELTWQSSASLGGSSSGLCGSFDTAEEAEVAKAAAEADHADAVLRQPLAETGFYIMRIEIDSHGNKSAR